MSLMPYKSIPFQSLSPQANIPQSIPTQKVLDRDSIKPNETKPIKKFLYTNPPTTRMTIETVRAGQEQYQDYDLGLIAKYLDYESIVYQTLAKIEEKAFNAGAQYVGKDQEALSYVKQRFMDMAVVSGKPHDVFRREIFQDIIKYHNCFLYKFRDKSRSRGRSRVDNNDKILPPIAAYMRLDASSVVPVRDELGNVIKYKVGPTNKQTGIWRNISLKGGKPIWKDIPPEDIIHIYVKRDERNNIGTPWIWPALDDLRLLRKMEENVELLVQKHVFPFFHYIVGTESAPALAEEIENVTFNLELMPTEGGFVTPERHKVEILGTGKNSIDARPYLDYFRERVIAAMGIGPISLGFSVGGAKGGATVSDRNIIEKAKFYQAIFASFFNDLIIKELLLEGNYDPYDIKAGNDVLIQFNEIDIDTQIKKETQAANLYNNQGLTYPEYRISLGREPINESEEDWATLQANTFGVIKLAELQMQQTKEQANVASKQLNKKTSEGNNKPAKAANAASHQTGPANQHGKKLSPAKIGDSIADVSDSITHAVKNSDLANHFSMMLEKNYEIARTDILSKLIAPSNTIKDNEGIKMALGLTANNMKKTSFSYIFQAYKYGYIKAFDNTAKDEEVVILDAASEEALNKCNEFVDLTINKLQKHVITILANVDKATDKINTQQNVSALFDLYKPYLRKNAVTGVLKAHNYGRLVSYRNQNKPEAQIKTAEDACDTCKSHNNTKINTRTATLDEIPPYHQGCTCPIEVI